MKICSSLLVALSLLITGCAASVHRYPEGDEARPDYYESTAHLDDKTHNWEKTKQLDHDLGYDGTHMRDGYP